MTLRCITGAMTLGEVAFLASSHTKCWPGTSRQQSMPANPQGASLSSSSASRSVWRSGLSFADRIIEEVRGDDPDPASQLRIKERELEAGGLN
jgi:hypothetical protein